MSSVNLSYYSNNWNALVYTLQLKLSSLLLTLQQSEEQQQPPNFTFHNLSLLYKGAVDDIMGDTLTDLNALDIMIGEGTASRPLLKEGCNVHGIDGSAPLLRQCHTRRQFKDSNLRFDESNLKLKNLSDGTLPYPDDQFFITLSAQGLMHLEEGSRMIGEMLRITKPNGIILFDVLVHDEQQDTLKIRKPHDTSNFTLHALNGQTLKAEFSTHGLRLLEAPITKNFQQLDGTPIKIKHVALCLRK